MLSIGELARRTGLRPSALRYYEERGILPAPARVGGRRRYGADVIRRVKLLQFAQQAGFTLEEIRILLHGFGAETPPSFRWRLLAHKKARELDELAGRVMRMREALELGLTCSYADLENCKLPIDAP